jgi:hypothetical protein
MRISSAVIASSGWVGTATVSIGAPYLASDGWAVGK